MSNTIVGNRLFTLSFDPLNKNSIFTLGGIDERYVAPGYTTAWAELIKGTYEWGVYSDSFTFGPQHIEEKAEVLIKENSWVFEFTLNTFNKLTNYFLFNHPEFTRDQYLNAYYEGPCPKFEDLIINLTSSDSSASPIQVKVTSEQYLAQSDGYCDLLFRQSMDNKTRLGLTLLEKYVVSFDSDNERVGFTERNY